MDAGIEIKPIVIDDPLEWATDLPQPEFKCFNCRQQFDSKAKMPMLLPCEHTVCKECIIEKES